MIIFVLFINMIPNLGYCNSDNNIIHKKRQFLFSENELYQNIEASELVGVAGNTMYWISDNKLIAYDMSTKEFNNIYSIEDNIMYNVYCTEDNLILVLLDYNHNASIVYFHKFKIIDSLINKEVVRMPSCFTTKDNKFYYNIEYAMGKTNKYDIFEQEFSELDLSTNKWRLIKRLRYASIEGKTFGRSINSVGGNSESVFFQVIKSINGAFENAANAILYKYELCDSNEKFKHIFKQEVPFLSIHIGGGGDYVLLNKYNHLIPLEGVGKLYRFNDEEFKLLYSFDKINSGSDIINSSYVDGYIFFNNQIKLYVVNIDEEIVIVNKYDFEQNLVTTPVGAYFINKEEDSYYLNHIFIK